MLGRPVKICLTREEVFYCHRGRHPVLMRFKTGVTNDGTITGDAPADAARRRRATARYGVACTFYTGALQTVTYHIPRYHFDGCRAFTNKPPCGPKRGHGTPQPRFGQEVQLDKIAEALGARSRPSCACSIVEQPDTLTANWLRVGTIGLAECIRRVVAALAAGSKRRGKLPHGPRRRPRLLVVPLRRGPADLLERHAALGRAAQARPQRAASRSFCGATEIGQGSDDVLAAIVAEVLGIDPVRHPLRHRRHRPHAGRPRLATRAASR